MTAVLKEAGLSQFPLVSDEIRMLADIGFFALQAGYVVPALAILHGFRVLRPHHAFPFIGIALAHLVRGSINDAVSVLSEGESEVTVEREDFRLYQGLILSLAGQASASEAILEQLAEQNSLGSAQRFFLKTMLQKKHLNEYGITRPSPAKVFSTSSEES